MDAGSKKVLITGGSGFIGQHLAERFLEQGQQVCIYDLKEPSNALLHSSYVRGDVFDVEALREVAWDSQVVVHLVGLADAGIAQGEPALSFRLNIASLQGVLEACRQDGGKKLVFPSSAAVYGYTEDLPIKENFPERPTNIYAWHKLLAEKMVRAYHDNFGLSYVILRLFNVYGKGNRGVIDAFLDVTKRGEVIESFGPRQYRDFVYTGDVAEAFYRAAIYDKTTDRTVNIGTGVGTQIWDILDLVCELYPQARWVEVKRPFTMYDSIADTTLAHILLGLEPSASREFMKKVIQEEIA